MDFTFESECSWGGSRRRGPVAPALFYHILAAFPTIFNTFQQFSAIFSNFLPTIDDCHKFTSYGSFVVRYSFPYIYFDSRYPLLAFQPLLLAKLAAAEKKNFNDRLLVTNSFSNLQSSPFFR